MQAASRQEASTSNRAAPAAAKPSKPEPMDTSAPEDEDSKASREAKQEALQKKDLGNQAYKAKQFDEAIKHYDAAIELDDTDISFLTNR